MADLRPSASQFEMKLTIAGKVRMIEGCPTRAGETAIRRGKERRDGGERMKEMKQGETKRIRTSGFALRGRATVTMSLPDVREGLTQDIKAKDYKASSASYLYYSEGLSSSTRILNPNTPVQWHKALNSHQSAIQSWGPHPDSHSSLSLGTSSSRLFWTVQAQITLGPESQSLPHQQFLPFHSKSQLLKWQEQSLPFLDTQWLLYLIKCSSFRLGFGTPQWLGNHHHPHVQGTEQGRRPLAAARTTSPMRPINMSTLGNGNVPPVDHLDHAACHHAHTVSATMLTIHILSQAISKSLSYIDTGRGECAYTSADTSTREDGIMPHI
ncbi:hypothetical protein EDB89DRAFT_2169332 [Lactarius sanguifluus]|nr:hypothetical protein EDB89DRAFT_2169332 [Lactarius sanguifluus]